MINVCDETFLIQIIKLTIRKSRIYQNGPQFDNMNFIIDK